MAVAPVVYRWCPFIQAPVVQTLDSAIHLINHYQAATYLGKYVCAIHWIAIYPVLSQ